MAMKVRAFFGLLETARITFGTMPSFSTHLAQYFFRSSSVGSPAGRSRRVRCFGWGMHSSASGFHEVGPERLDRLEELGGAGVESVVANRDGGRHAAHRT